VILGVLVSLSASEMVVLRRLEGVFLGVAAAGERVRSIISRSVGACFRFLGEGVVGAAAMGREDICVD